VTSPCHYKGLCHICRSSRTCVRISQKVVPPDFYFYCLQTSHAKISQNFITALVREWLFFSIVSMFVNTFSFFEQKHGKHLCQSSTAIGSQHSSVYCYHVMVWQHFHPNFVMASVVGTRVTRDCQEGATFICGGEAGD